MAVRIARAPRYQRTCRPGWACCRCPATACTSRVRDAIASISTGRIDDGEFARHIRKMRAVYRVRHDLITDTLAHDFTDHLKVIPSTAGLHIAALARTASSDEIAAVARRASDAGIEVQELSKFAFKLP